MDITLYISRFLHRIRYQLILGSSIIAALVAYFTQFIPRTYTVDTSIYTGIASNTGLDEDKQDWQSVNNTFDNLVNLTKSRGTLEKVSLKLFALIMVNGNIKNDNLFIQAKTFKQLQETIPEDVKKLIDKESYEKTIEKLIQYKQEDPHNYLYKLFNGGNLFFSYGGLSQIIVNRLGKSDLINISYKSSDPGITLQTVVLISKELQNSYDELRYKTADDIVSYYEQELKKLRVQLNKMENELTDYNVDNSVINYGEQTKSLAIAFTEFETHYDEVEQQKGSSERLIEEMEQYMQTKTKLIKTNEDFIKALEDITSINGKITEIETFTSEEAQKTDENLLQYKEDLINAEKKIASLTEKINGYKESKEGISIDGLANEWLQQTIINIKAKAELAVLDQQKERYTELYKRYSPIGTLINRQEREIRVIEESYLQILHALNLSKMKQKNIRLTSASLNTISAPAYPLLSDKSKRSLIIMAAFIGSMIFIIGLNLVFELLDRTLRDSDRTKRLTGLSVLGALTGNSQLKYRGYIKACNRIAAAYTCNRINSLLNKNKTVCINLLSLEEREGKTFVSDYMMEYWEEQGVSVKRVIAEDNISFNASFLFTKNTDYLLKENDTPNILLIEHQAIQKNNISAALLQDADLNILIANAKRVWKNSDHEAVKYLKSILGTTPLYIYLNNAQREVVEDFTGILPPKSSVRSFTNRIIYLGFTAKDSAVK